nr:hypothetical protein [Deltaproteobacteria bacterium]
MERRDPQGNAATLEYDSNRRLTVIRAASGETLTFYYRTEAYGAEYYLVDHVELSDGRTANFSYTTRDPNGRLILSGIADMGGIESTFNYTETARGYADGGTVPFPDHDFLSSLKTPYGSTGFRTGWAANRRGPGWEGICSDGWRSTFQRASMSGWSFGRSPMPTNRRIATDSHLAPSVMRARWCRRPSTARSTTTPMPAMRVRPTRRTTQSF